MTKKEEYKLIQKLEEIEDFQLELWMLFRSLKQNNILEFFMM
jgi:hypothetical protein